MAAATRAPSHVGYPGEPIGFQQPAFFSQISPVRLSVTVPFPLSANLGLGHATPFRSAPSCPGGMFVVQPTSSTQLVPSCLTQSIAPVFGTPARGCDPATPKRFTPDLTFPATRSASPATVPDPSWYPAAIGWFVVPGVIVTAPLFGIVPVRPAAVAFENVFPERTSATAASPVALSTDPVTPKRFTPARTFVGLRSVSPTTVPEPLWYPARIACDDCPGVIVTAPRFVIVPLWSPHVPPLVLRPQNVVPFSTIASTAPFVLSGTGAAAITSFVDFVETVAGPAAGSRNAPARSEPGVPLDRRFQMSPSV